MRTVVVGGGFSLMAALLAVHGLSTPGMVIGPNGADRGDRRGDAARRRCRDGALRAAAVRSAAAIPRVLAVEGVARRRDRRLQRRRRARAAARARRARAASAPAIALFALGLVVYGALAVRAMNTFLLTRRAADFAVVLGIVLLACSLYGALILSFMDLGWWLGHIFEMAGIVVVGASLVCDLRRGRRSRALVGDLRAAELVAAEEAFLGARVRALMVRLAREGHLDGGAHATRRDARGRDRREARPLPDAPAQPRDRRAPARHRQALDPGGDPAEARPARRRRVRVVKLHPERGRELLNELGGFDEAVGAARARPPRAARRQRLPARRSTATSSTSRRGSSRVCDVYDALVSPRAYRPAWSREQALSLLHDESDVAFDSRCVAALERIVGVERDAVAHVELRAASPAPSGP